MKLGMKLGFKRGEKGFTLVELMVVVAILGVLMAIVAPAVTGTKEVSTEGQVMSDGKATQTAVDNFNNKSIRPNFPDAATGNLTTAADPTYRLVTTTGETGYHIYNDIWAHSAKGANVTLLNKDGTNKNEDGTAKKLNSLVTKSGTSLEVLQWQFVDFAKVTKVYDADGSVKDATYVPDFLMKEPSSLPLKGDESTAGLSKEQNTYEEFLWLLLVNAPGTSQESRTLQVYRMTAFTKGSVATGPHTIVYTQVY